MFDIVGVTSGLSGPGPWTLVQRWRGRGPEWIGVIDIRVKHKCEFSIDAWLVEHRAGNGPVKLRSTASLQDAQQIVEQLKADHGEDWEQLPV